VDHGAHKHRKGVPLEVGKAKRDDEHEGATQRPLGEHAHDAIVQRHEQVLCAPLDRAVVDAKGVAGDEALVVADQAHGTIHVVVARAQEAQQVGVLKQGRGSEEGITGRGELVAQGERVGGAALLRLLQFLSSLLSATPSRSFIPLAYYGKGHRLAEADVLAHGVVGTKDIQRWAQH